MDEKRLRELSGQEQEEKELLSEAVSKIAQKAFDEDAQIFPVEIKVSADFGQRDGTVTLSYSSANDRSITGDLKNLQALAARRLAALNRKMKLGGKGEQQGFVAVRFKDVGIGIGPASPSEKIEKSAPIRLAKGVAQKLKMKAVKSNLTGPGSLRFSKQYKDLEELSRDLDKIDK